MNSRISPPTFSASGENVFEATLSVDGTPVAFPVTVTTDQGYPIAQAGEVLFAVERSVDALFGVTFWPLFWAFYEDYNRVK